jgi:hypothetical protein
MTKIVSRNSPNDIIMNVTNIAFFLYHGTAYGGGGKLRESYGVLTFFISCRTPDAQSL